MKNHVQTEPNCNSLLTSFPELAQCFFLKGDISKVTNLILESTHSQNITPDEKSHYLKPSNMNTIGYHIFIHIMFITTQFKQGQCNLFQALILFLYMTVVFSLPLVFLEHTNKTDLSTSQKCQILMNTRYV